MAAIGTYSWTIVQGATFSETWTRSGVSSAAGWSAALDVREGASSSAALIISLSTDNGRIALSSNGTSLIIALTIAAADTALLDFDLGYYDLKLTAPDGTVEYLLEGTVRLNRRITV